MSIEGRSLRRTDRSKAPRRLSRRGLLTAAVGFLAGSSSMAVGWIAARRQASLPLGPASGKHRLHPLAESAHADLLQLEVTGASMAPTLTGRHLEAICGACGANWAAYGEFTPGQKAAIVCWNCGAEVTLDTTAVRPGTAVRLIPQKAFEFAFPVGALIAVRWPSELGDSHYSGASPTKVDAENAGTPPSLSVKRVAAGPGQVVTHRDYRLMVDGELPLPDRNWLLVHDDTYRNAGVSWWESERTRDSKAVEQTADGFRLRAIAHDADQGAEPAGDWLVYHHHSVHNSLRPDVIRDDMPGNVTEVRALLPVSRLRLSMQVEGLLPGTLEIAFWQQSAVQVQRMAFSSGGSALKLIGPDLQAATASTAERSVTQQPAAFVAVLSAQRPIAIRVLAGAAEISRLRIERPLEYRIDPRLAAKHDWPIRLAKNEYFLLGDNVPLSIDSRHFGPVAGHRIVGSIELVGYDGSRR